MINSLQNFYLRYFPEIVLVVFVVLGFLGILRHELWFDEMQAWQIAKSSHSLAELYSNLKYECHPPLWYFLLMILKNIYNHPFSMQVLHIGIASVNAWIVLKYSPFSKLQKFLLVFSYFLFYEYAIISRSYALGVLLIFILCILLKQLIRNYLLLALVLILLCLSSFVGLILSIAFALFIMYEFFENFDHNNHDWNRFFLASILFNMAILISLKMMIVPHSGAFEHWIAIQGGDEIFSGKIHNIYFPDKFSLSFGNILNRIIAIGSVFILFSTFLFFIRKRSVFFLYSVGVIAFILSFSFIQFCEIRHIGHLFIFLIACCWIWPNISVNAKRLLTILLLIQFCLGLRSYMIDWRYDFSDEKNAAVYIKTQGLDQLPIVVEGMCHSAVIGYLDKPVFFTKGSRWSTFDILDNAKSLSPGQIMAKVRSLSQSFKQDVLLISTYPFRQWYLLSNVKKIKEFHQTFGDDRPFHLYFYRYTYTQEK